MPWLTVLILVPIIGALVLAAMPSKPGSFLPRQLALLVSVYMIPISVPARLELALLRS